LQDQLEAVVAEPVGGLLVLAADLADPGGVQVEASFAVDRGTGVDGELGHELAGP
jgi:hypothetical protein